MCIVIVWFPVDDAINFEINLSFLTKPFSYMTKKIRTKLKCLKNEKSFYEKIKRVLILSSVLAEQEQFCCLCS